MGKKKKESFPRRNLYTVPAKVYYTCPTETTLPLPSSGASCGLLAHHQIPGGTCSLDQPSFPGNPVSPPLPPKDTQGFCFTEYPWHFSGPLLFCTTRISWTSSGDDTDVIKPEFRSLLVTTPRTINDDKRARQLLPDMPMWVPAPMKMEGEVQVPLAPFQSVFYLTRAKSHAYFGEI